MHKKVSHPDEIQNIIIYVYVEFQDTFFVSNNMIPSKTYVRTKVTFNLIDNRYHNDNIISRLREHMRNLFSHWSDCVDRP